MIASLIIPMHWKHNIKSFKEENSHLYEVSENGKLLQSPGRDSRKWPLSARETSHYCNRGTTVPEAAPCSEKVHIWWRQYWNCFQVLWMKGKITHMKIASEDPRRRQKFVLGNQTLGSESHAVNSLEKNIFKTEPDLTKVCCFYRFTKSRASPSRRLHRHSQEYHHIF